MTYFGATSRAAGDPGFFDVLKTIGRFAAPFIPGGSIVSSGIDAITGRGRRGGIPQIPNIGIQGTRPFAGPGGKTIGGPIPKSMGGPGRRRMNPMNTKALTRANRRIDSFVKHTKKILKNTNFKLVSKSTGSRSSKRDLGRGHTHVR